MDVQMQDLIAIVDSREQNPWLLDPMQTEVGTLSVGDYSLKNLESVIALERKSLADFVACCGSERDRFQRELDRLRGWPVSAVVIEASWADLQLGGWRSRLTPKQVQSSFCAWVAQGHRLVLGKSHDESGKIASAILFYAARYRLREVKPFLDALVKQ
jgi:DNA excision repair protein ERCC-4